MEPKKEILKNLVSRNRNLSCSELDDFFSTLDSVEIGLLLGEWKIGYLFTKEGTGSFFETITKGFPVFRLYSKRFITKDKVQAWIYDFFGFKFIVPFTDAFLQEIEFRGKISTSLVYKHLPMTDFLRKIDNNTVMGIMKTRDKLNLYFYLEKI
jgi:hypothetical protein